MDTRQIERLNMVVSSLKEFCYGLDRLDEISMVSEQGSAQMRFYMNSLYEYTAKYYLLYKKISLPIGGNLYPALKELGLSNYLNPIISTLNEKIGNLDLQTILKTFRNKMVTHSNYTFEMIEKKIYEIEDLRKSENYGRFQELLQRLYGQTKELYLKLSNLSQ